MRSNENRSKSGRLPRTDASTDALHTLQQAFSNANAARPNLFGTHSILSVAQPRIAHARISHVMHGCSAIRDQNGISVNEENTTRSYISNLVMTNETEPQTRRFYVDLSPEQEKVLLKKANHFFCRKRGLPDSKSELTIELFQQLVDLLATAWKEQHTVLESFWQHGVRPGYP